MQCPIPTSTEHVAGLVLAGGSSWEINAANDRANGAVLALVKIMQLQPLEKRVQKKSHYHTSRRLIVQVEDHKEDHKIDSAQFSTTIHLTFEDKNTIVCTLNSK